MKFTTTDLVLLKTFITNKKYAIEFSNEGDVKLFSPDLYKFANLIKNYIKIYQELPTKRVILERAAKSDSPSVQEYISEVWDKIEEISYDDKEYKHDLDKLKSQYAIRLLSNHKDNIQLDDSSDPKLLEKAVRDMELTVSNIKGVYKTKSFSRRTLKEIVPDFMEKYKRKQQNPDFGRGTLTGYSYMDYVLNGIQESELLLVAAESGGGKSIFLNNIAIQMYMQNNNIENIENFVPGNDILYLSLEMPEEQCFERTMSRLANVRSIALRDAKLRPEEGVRVNKAMKFMRKYPHEFEIVDSPRGTNINTIENIFNDVCSRYKPKVVVVDYLGLMDVEGGDKMEDWLKLGKIAEQLHEFARIHKVIVLSAVQLNRVSGKSGEAAIGMHRIGRSAMIMHNANFGIQIESRPNEDQCPDMMCHFIKNRRGQLGKFRLLKNFSNSSLLDDQMVINEDAFTNPDDISSKLELLESDSDE